MPHCNIYILLCSNNSTDANKLYEKKIARKASTTYKHIADILENKGFTIGNIRQQKVFPNPMPSGTNYPVGDIEIKSNKLSDADKILGLPELNVYRLNITGGYENDTDRGMHGINWNSSNSFLKDYQEKWNYGGIPDYLILTGKDPISQGEINLLIGQLPQKKNTLCEIVKEFFQPTTINLK